MRVTLSGTVGSWTLPRGSWIVGRAPECQVRIPDSRLSRKHAQLVVSAGDVLLVDTGSTNGVAVNGEAVSGNRRLADGDQLRIGPFHLTIAIDATQPHARSLEAPATGGDGPGHRTDVMEPVQERKIAQPITTRRTRAVDPAIAAAISGSRSSVASSSTLFPGDIPSSSSGALTSLAQVQPPAAAPRPPTAMVFNPGEAPRASSPLLERPADLVAPGPHLRLRRLLAGAGHAVTGLALPLGTGSAVAACGLGAALAGHADLDASGLPVLARHTLPWGDLAAACASPAGMLRTIDLLTELRLLAPGAAMGVVLSLAAGLLTALAWMLLALVAATVTKGAPLFHRLAGLTLVRASDRLHLHWGRALWRWLWTGLLLPVAWIGVATGGRGPHDLITGCAVLERRR